MPHIQKSKRFLTWWVALVERRHLLVILSFTLVTLGILAYSVKNFKINDDLTNMISEKLPFRHLEKQLFKEFPQLTDVIVVVVDADSVDDAIDARLPVGPDDVVVEDFDPGVLVGHASRYAMPGVQLARTHSANRSG